MKTVKRKVHDIKARKAMMRGVNKLADVVGSTMGAKGRNVLIEQPFGPPFVINDGVSIAREMFFEDPLEDTAAQLIKDAAIRTNTLAGDGTTGSTVLARAILEEGWKAVGKGINEVALRKELTEASTKIIEKLKKSANKIKTKKQAIQIAQVSVQDKDLGKQIGELMYDLGPTGAVTIKDAVKPGVVIEKKRGTRMEGALMGGIVENNDKWETRFGDAHILVLKDSPEDHEFETKWLPFVRQLAEATKDDKGNASVQVKVPALIIVAEKLSKKFAMQMNQNKDLIKWVWFRPTTAGKNMKEVYKDLISLVGGTAIDEEDGVFLSRFEVRDLGNITSAVLGRSEMVVTVEDEVLGSDIYMDRVRDVEAQVENAENEDEQENIKDRLANLTGGVASIKVMSSTDQDTLELKLRLEDAINATRAAMEEGYVPGGGIALLDAVKDCDAETFGEGVLYKACLAPYKQILDNAGYKEEEVDNFIPKLAPGEGLDVLAGEYVNMVKQGVVDPLKVIRLSLEHAVSVAGLLLTSRYAITTVDDEADTLKNLFNPKKQ